MKRARSFFCFHRAALRILTATASNSSASEGSWSRHPVLGWLDAVAAAMLPDAELEFVSKWWASGSHSAKEPSVNPTTQAAEGAATSFPFQGGPDALTPAQSAALQLTWERMRLVSASGLVDAEAVSAALAPLVPAAVSAALVAAADVTGRGALTVSEWVSLAQTVLVGNEDAAAALLFFAADAMSRDGVLDPAEVVRAIELVTYGTLVAISTQPVPLPGDALPPSVVFSEEASSTQPSSPSYASSPVVVDAAMGTVSLDAMLRLHASAHIQARTECPRK